MPAVTGETQPIMRMVELLPAPFGPEEAEGFAATDVEVDAVDGDEVAEALDEPACMDHRAVLAHASTLPAGERGLACAACRATG